MNEIKSYIPNYRHLKGFKEDNLKIQCAEHYIRFKNEKKIFSND